MVLCAYHALDWGLAAQAWECSRQRRLGARYSAQRRGALARVGRCPIPSLVSNSRGSLQFVLEDKKFMHRAIELALLAEREGNLPVGAVITLHGEVEAEGRSAIWVPKFDATRHAEIEALRAVRGDLWGSSAEMTLYTTLEPCLMCFGSILLHQIGRVVFGSSDSYGGAGSSLEHLPPYFHEQMKETQWLGTYYAR